MLCGRCWSGKEHFYTSGVAAALRVMLPFPAAPTQLSLDFCVIPELLCQVSPTSTPPLPPLLLLPAPATQIQGMRPHGLSGKQQLMDTQLQKGKFPKNPGIYCSQIHGMGKPREVLPWGDNSWRVLSVLFLPRLFLKPGFPLGVLSLIIPRLEAAICHPGAVIPAPAIIVDAAGKRDDDSRGKQAAGSNLASENQVSSCNSCLIPAPLSRKPPPGIICPFLPRPEPGKISALISLGIFNFKLVFIPVLNVCFSSGRDDFSVPVNPCFFSPQVYLGLFTNVIF